MKRLQTTIEEEDEDIDGEELDDDDGPPPPLFMLDADGEPTEQELAETPRDPARNLGSNPFGD